MSREEYAAYLRRQAKALLLLADEVESGSKVTCDWLVDWELHQETALLQQELNRECEQAAKSMVI